MNHSYFIEKAIQLALEGIASGGGPFGAVIVLNDIIIGEGNNCVVLHNDPTAHAEIMAIRTACKKLNTYDLSGSVIYSTCEPCPMCLAAIWWSRINKIFYSNDRHDAKKIGFDDEDIYNEVSLPLNKRKLQIEKITTINSKIPFKMWANKEDKVSY